MSEKTYLDGLKKAVEIVQVWHGAASGLRDEEPESTLYDILDSKARHSANILDDLKLHIALEEERHAANQPE